MSNASTPESTCSTPTTRAVRELTHSRQHAAQPTVDRLNADRMSLIAVFRAGFAAFHFDVRPYSDDELAAALCGESVPAAVPSYREHLKRAFKRLRPAPFPD